MPRPWGRRARGRAGSSASTVARFCTSVAGGAEVFVGGRLGAFSLARLARAVEEGFAYSLQGAIFDGTRLRFSVAMNELWKGWCELQTTIYTTPAQPPCSSSSSSSGSSTGTCRGGPLTYGCLPTSNNLVGGAQGCAAPFLAGADGGPVTFDCGNVFTCGLSSVDYRVGPCSCTTTSCTMDTSHPDVAFDMAWTPGHLDGSSSAITANSPYATSPVNVHFTA